jgi:photosystem II stability/assembly factor-like uncharacterized protein
MKLQKHLFLLPLSVLLLVSVPLVGCDSTGSNAPSDSPSAVPPSENEPGVWSLVRSSTENTIHDVALTSEGAYAVAEGGLLLKRQEDTWAPVLNDGPSSNGSDLYGLAVTADSTHLWLVGASGAIGEYDVTTGSLTDRSAPMDVTNNFRDVAVTGPADSANVYVTGASGQVYHSFENGASGTWNDTTPGNGSALRAVDFHAARSGRLVDANQTVFNTTDGGTWTSTGIENADVSLYGVDSDASDDVWGAAGSGTVFQWNGSEWTSTVIGEASLRDIEVASEDQSGYAVGGGASVFAYDGTEWTSEETPTTENLRSIVLSTSSTPAIAVGAGGTILEK